MCATTDRRTLPAFSTWHLTTNLPAPLGEIVRLNGLRNWVEQSYKQMKDEFDWADSMLRSDRAIRRHWMLVYCAFAFCWWQAASQDRSGDDQPAQIPKAPSEAREKTSCVKALPH